MNKLQIEILKLVTSDYNKWHTFRNANFDYVSAVCSLVNIRALLYKGGKIKANAESNRVLAAYPH